MKICEEFAALLDAFVDGELSPEEAQAVQTHLNTCPACQAYVDDALAMRAAFPTVEDTEVPPDFAADVLRAIGTQSTVPEKHRRQPWGRVLLPIAACFALVLVLKTASPAFRSDKAVPAEATNGFSTDSRAVEDPLPEASAPAPAQASIPESVEEDTVSADVLPELSTNPSTYQSSSSMRRDAEPSAYFARMTLTAQEVGDLLAEWTPVSKTETEQVYELTEADYHALLEALDAAGIFPAVEASGTTDTGALALVTVLY